MERHLDKRTIAEPVADLFAGLSQAIAVSNEGWLLPSSDELNEHVPKVRVVDKPMFPKSK
jgi:hypothetical protein